MPSSRLSLLFDHNLTTFSEHDVPHRERLQRRNFDLLHTFNIPQRTSTSISSLSPIYSAVGVRRTNDSSMGRHVMPLCLLSSLHPTRCFVSQQLFLQTSVLRLSLARNKLQVRWKRRRALQATSFRLLVCIYFTNHLQAIYVKVAITMQQLPWHDLDSEELALVRVSLDTALCPCCWSSMKLSTLHLSDAKVLVSCP